MFGWSLEPGPSGFDYVTLPAPRRRARGSGQAQPGQAGQEPGTNFYVVVDDLDAALTRAEEAGGSVLLAPTSVDGYTFAMFEDPERNTVGVVLPFPSEGAG